MNHVSATIESDLHVSAVIESDLPDLSMRSLGEVTGSDDSWLERAVERIRAEVAADPAAAVAAFNSSL
jgi:FXSXX-COOH protein